MPQLLKTLLGLKPSPWAEGGSWRLEWLAAPHGDRLLFLLLAVGAAAWGVLYLYRREGRGLSFPVRASLAGLRMVALVGVVVMLLEPAVVFVRTDHIPSDVLVLVDRSESMELRDAYANQGYAQQLADALQVPGGPTELRDRPRSWLVRRALDGASGGNQNGAPAGGLVGTLAAGGDRTVHVQGFAGQLVDDAAASPASTGHTASPPASQPSIDSSATALGGVLRQALAAYRGHSLAGIVVLSDGQSNTGESPVKAAEGAGIEGIPIVTIGAGTPEGPRNAKVTKIEVSKTVFMRDPNPFRVIVESRGLAKSPATLVVERRRQGGPWEELSRQPITLEENGRVQSIPFEFREDRPTSLDLRATLTDVGPELTTADNVATESVQVVSQRIHVLFIAGNTFPEVEFLRNALFRDKAIRASTWLQSADAAYEQPGDPSIKRLPRTQEELDEKFDCVVLYDPDPSAWPPQFGQMLADFVGKAGGGLIYIAGERMTKHLFERQEDPSLAWLGVLPVVAEPGLYQTEVSMKLSAREAWKLELMPEGKSDSIFRFNANAEENERILGSLPGMYWHFPVTRAKPGATVLARHGDPRMRNEHGAQVLLATQLVGPGRTFFVGFDSTYRWRFLDEQYFDGFWSRMIDRAGRTKQLGGRYPYTLSTDRAEYRPGSPVTLVARFESPGDRDAGLEILRGEVEVPDAAPIPITLSPRAGETGAFETTFPVTRPGTHFIKVWPGAEEGKTVTKAATLQFNVQLPNLEYERPTLDAGTLQAVAKASGGAYFDLTHAADAASVLKVRRVVQTLEDRQEIWHAPLLFATVLLALFVEWVLRKRFRMV